MALIINDLNKCKCGAYWQGNGFCANGHPNKPTSKDALKVLNKREKMLREKIMQYLINSTASNGEIVRVLAKLINDFKKV